MTAAERHLRSQGSIVFATWAGAEQSLLATKNDVPPRTDVADSAAIDSGRYGTHAVLIAPTMTSAPNATVPSHPRGLPNGQRISGERGAEGDERVRCMRVLGSAWTNVYRAIG